MRGSSCLLCGFSLLLLASITNAADDGSENNSTGVYIVYKGSSVNALQGVARSDHAQLLNELMERKENSVVHTYNHGFLGFAARLSAEEAELMAQNPGVVSVFPDRAAQLQTTRSWDFLMTQTGAAESTDSTPTASPSESDSSGAHDTIIGIIDSGIWPELPSFDDKNMGPIPPRWKGICMPGNNITCNRKVIGARYYDSPGESGFMGSARDEAGHGTHVASIAAGSPVWGESYYGLATGTARGGSPNSRIAVYRACGDDGKCQGSAILKGFDDAIADGVDVISVSLNWRPHGQVDPFLTDPIVIGAFHAVEKGIIVVGSASNNGPGPGTVLNVAPWILTVAATTIDRDFEAGIVLGRDTVIKGGGINFSGLKTSAVYNLVDARSTSNQSDVAHARNCLPGSLDNNQVKGKIVVCENNDDYGTRAKFWNLRKQGAIGMIMIDNKEAQVPFNYGTFPIAAVNEEDGARIRSYINSTASNALATILPTRSVIPSYKPAPAVVFFSSRGPPDPEYGIQNLIKPDVAAPGLGILAAWPPFNDLSWSVPSNSPPLFNIDSGTSMSCPHVSGLAATVKSLHPIWSPSAIRSAIMTSATHTNNQYASITTEMGTRATPYDIGAGEISLTDSLSPGLVYETETTDYVNFLCNVGHNASLIKIIASTVPNNFSCPGNSSPDSISDMNYPSIAVSRLNANVTRTVKRTVTNVGEVYSTYVATVEASAGIHAEVVPNILAFTRNVKKLTFQVTFKLATISKEDTFGSITWSNGKYKVRIPFVASNV